MKTSILFTFFLFLAASLLAQSQAVTQLAGLYPDDEIRSELTLSGSWLKMLTSGNDDAKESNGYLKKVHFLSVPRPSGLSMRQFSNKIEREGYELLTSFRSNQDQGYILIKETRAGITDLVATFTGEEDKLVTISVSGLFTLDDLDNLDVDIDGWGNVKKAR